jgi:hypothetical protein
VHRESDHADRIGIRLLLEKKEQVLFADHTQDNVTAGPGFQSVIHFARQRIDG